MSLLSSAGTMRDKPIRTIEEVSDGIIVSYTFNNPEIIESDYYPNTKYISYDGFGLNDNDGEPCIPFRNDIFLVPNNCNVTVSVLDSLFTDTTMVLSPSMPVQTDNNSKVIRHNIIPYNGFSPKAIIHSSGVFHNREDALVEVSVIPVKYDYQTNTVRRYSYIRYKLTYSRSNSGFKGKRASMAKKICQNLLVRESATDSVCRNNKHYLIVTTSEYKNSLEDFVRWKRLKGYNVHVTNRAKGSWTVPSVKDSIQYYYNRDSIYHMLIVGDIDDVPADSFIANSGIAVTDYYYGLPVNDIPQIRRGRIPVNNVNELKNVLSKIIKYEQTPITDSLFYKTALHCGRFEDSNNDHYEDRCFTQTVEELGNYIKTNFNKNVIRGYACSPFVTPTNWNRERFSYGDSIPLDLRRGLYNWKYTGYDIQHVIEDGVFYVLFRGHGFERSWSSPIFPPPPYELVLNNDDKLPFFFNITCLNGRYNLAEDCMAEELLKNECGGGVGVIAATDESYSGYNDAMAYGMFDAIWPGFSPIYGLRGYETYTTFTEPTYEVGEIMDMGLIRMKETWGTPRAGSSSSLIASILWHKDMTFKLFHCFGDPSMMIYTETPRCFCAPTVCVSEDSIYINVSERGCRINIVSNTTGMVQSYLGNKITQYIGDDDVSVCIDKHNYVPYIWHRNLYIQDENIISANRVFHAENVQIGKQVTDQKPHGNVNVENSNIFIKADNVLLDRGTYINKKSTFKIKKVE